MQLALIPVKELSFAKARLAPVLDEERRRQLVLALYRDVLAAALACDVLDGVAVVTRDEELLTIARELSDRGNRFGIASACIGGGQGIAVLLENPAAA